MAVTFEEVLMAPGSFSLDCEWDADVAKALKVLPGPHLLLWWDEQLLPPWVILTANLDPIQIGGNSLLWHLGVAADGPVIEDREYLAGTNRLGNGGFEAGDAYWEKGKGALWVIDNAGPVHSGTFSARMTAVATEDEIISSSETFDTRSNDQWGCQHFVRRLDAGTVGRSRLRLVFEGQYQPPNLVQNHDFTAGDTHWSYSTNVGGTPAVGVISGSLKLGPIPQPDLLTNGSFEDDLTGWSPSSGSDGWYSDSGSHIDGAKSVSTPVGPANKFLSQRDVVVVPGQRLKISGYTAGSSDATGHSQLTFSLYHAGTAATVSNAQLSPPFDIASIGGSTWKQWESEQDVPEGLDRAAAVLGVYDHTVGIWSFDGVRLVRTRGNEVMAATDLFTVVSGLQYHVDCKLHSEVEGTGGSVLLRARFTAPGRPDVVQTGYAVENTKTLTQVATLDFTPPSGYGTGSDGLPSCRIEIVGQDITGGAFRVESLDVRQTDNTVTVIDVPGPPANGVWQSNTRITRAPVGTDRVRIEVVAEAGTQWAIDDVVLYRAENSYPTVASIVADLLKHPDTGLNLLGAGTIHGTDTLVYDWRIKFFTNLAALQHLARSGVALPVREYRVDADAKLSFGTAGPPDNLFTDRSAFVFSNGQVEVLQAPDAIVSGEERITKVRVIGADRRRPNGDHLLITGTATNPSGGSVDWFGNPVARTRVVQDSAVDQPDYASSLARYQADMALSAGSTRLQLADWTASGQFDVGDWVYVYKPEAGLEDPANERTIDGRIVFPARRRVVSRTLNPGPGPFRAELRLPDGSTLPLSVRWNDKTTAEIEVGDPRPEFVTDPQGGPAGLQLLRFRSSQGGRAA